MMKIIFIGWLLLISSGCKDIPQGTIHSNKLVSSKGEEIFINSINWGVTDDSQLSIISKDSLRLQRINDTIGTVEGLDPFIYHFRNDTLTLFFGNQIDYQINEKFNTITVIYKLVESDEQFLTLTEKSNENIEYFSVPKR